MANEDIKFSASLDTSAFTRGVKNMQNELNRIEKLVNSGQLNVDVKFGIDKAAFQSQLADIREGLPQFIDIETFAKENLAQSRRINDRDAQLWIDNEQRKNDFALDAAAKRNASEIKFAKDARDKELAGMRRSMEETARIEDEKFKFYQERNKKEIQVAEQARKAELANMRLVMSERFSAQQKQISLPSLRYALYDVSNITQQATNAIQQMGVAIISTAMEYETAFTAIERTTLANSRRLELMSYQFNELAREIPMAFGQITEIASLGAQMNIANSDLAGFTDTVAKFAATTNVSIDTAATSFGALGELLNISAERYSALGSAVAYVGINSVATESEVLSVATAIGGVAAQAGVSEDYVIGLAGALSSLRVPAEQSRGALTRIFQEVNRAAASGGEPLQNFANVLGMTAEQAKELAATDMGGFLSRLASGLSGMSSQELTTTLDALNLNDVRVTNVIARLSSNMDVLNKSLEDSAYGFENSAILSQLYASKVEDLQSKIQILNNSFAELKNEIGEAITPAVGWAIDAITDAIQNLTDALSTDAGKVFAGTAVVIGSVIGIFTSLITTLSLATAGFAAFKTVVNTLGIAEATKGLAGFIATLAGTNKAALAAEAGLRGVEVSALSASRATRAFKISLASTGIGLAVILLSELAIAFYSAGESADIAFKNMIGNTSGLAEALQSDREAFNQMAQSGASAEELGEKFKIIDLSSEAAKNKTEGFNDAIINMYDALGQSIPALAELNEGFEDTTRVIGDATVAWITNALLASEEFQGLFEDVNFTKFIKGVQSVGFSLDEFIKIASTGTEEELLAYIYQMQQAALSAGIEIPVYVSMVGPGNYEWRSTGAAGDFLFGTEGRLNMEKLVQVTQGLGGAFYLAQSAAGDAGAAGVDAMEGIGGAAGGAAEKIYLLTDYANDLATIWERAGDIRFSGTETFDKVAKSLSDIAKATQDAIDNIKELTADIDSLNADRALQQYFLSVAEAYGDTLSAQKIRANLAKIDADLTKKTKDLQKAQDKTNKTLVGNSDVAIENRKDILDLVKSYQDHIKALSESGMKQDELRAKTSQLRADFIAQATQLGYNEQELQQYAVAFDDVRAAIDNVPRDITVDFNGDAALTAIEEFAAKSRAAISGAGGSVPVTVDPAAAASAGKATALIASKAALEEQINTYKQMPGMQNQLRSLYSTLTRVKIQLANLGYADGGYTGAGGKYEVAGIVHRGEYVVPKEQVNQTTGLPYYMSQPRSFAQGGYTGQSGPTMVMLSPEDRALLRNAGGSGEVVLYANNEALARSVNAGNRSIVAAGGRP